MPVEYNAAEAVSLLVPPTGTEVFILRQAAERNTVETRWNTQQVGKVNSKY